jgi:hypothetical protein
LAKRGEKNLLYQVIYFGWRDTGEKNAVNHPRIAVIEPPKRGAIPLAGSVDERVFLARFCAGPDSHRLTFHA